MQAYIMDWFSHVLLNLSHIQFGRSRLESLPHRNRKAPVESFPIDHYWDDVLRGTVNLEESKRKLWGDVLTRLKASFDANNDELSSHAIETEMAEEYPRQAVDAALREMYEDSDVSYRDEKYIHHGYATTGIPSLRARLKRRLLGLLKPF